MPDIAIFATATRMVATRLDEGFDELCRVSIADAGAFDVQRHDTPA